MHRECSPICSSCNLPCLMCWCQHLFSLHVSEEKKKRKIKKHLMYGLLTSEFQGKVGRKHIQTACHSLWQVPKQTSDWLQWNISGKRAGEREMMGLNSLLGAVFLLHRGSLQGKNLKPFYRSIRVHGHGAVCLRSCISVFVGETDGLCVPLRTCAC